MAELSELGAILVGTRVVSREQWDGALAAGEAAKNDVDAVLAIINHLAPLAPHWWDGKQPQPPGLTEYQQIAIRSRFVDDELAFLRRDLALNQFLLLTKLGQGGQGEVYRARQLNPPRYAAIKTLIRDTDVRRRRFEQEARAMMKIQNPAVARFYLYERVRDASGEPTDEYVIAMEFVHGTPMHRHVQRAGTAPWRFTIHWTIQLLGGLAAIHRSGLVHGDVKPENVMVMGPAPGPNVRVESTSAKLLDFGAARRTDAPEAGEEPRRTFVGTPEYAPPEQWTGAEVPASDLYSLGGTLYYMLTGRFPYQKDRRDPFAYRDSHTKDPVLEVREFNPGVPPELSAVLKRMLAKDPAERGTADELIAAFKVLLPREAPTPVPADRPRTKPKAASPKPAAPKPTRKPTAPVERNPIYAATDNTLAFFEKLFIPGHFRPPQGEEAAIPERLAGLIRRPIVLVLAILFLGAVLYGLYKLI